MALERRGILKLKYPVEHGMVTNWNDIEKLWHHAFYNELRVSPEETNVIVLDHPLNPKNNKEKCCSIMFETFNVNSFLLVPGELMSLFASGRVSGCVLKSGSGYSSAVPIFEGNIDKQATKTIPLGGRDVTEYFVKILSERGYDMTTSAEREIVNDIKEFHSFVSLDYDYDLKNGSSYEMEYKLPDESQMTIASERFRAPEILFKPSLCGAENDSLTKMCTKAISQNLESDLMFKNIVLSGGNCVIPNYNERVLSEMRDLNEKTKFINVITPLNPEFSEWKGASLFSMFSCFDQKLITKDDYDETGPSIVHRKLF